MRHETTATHVHRGEPPVLHELLDHVGTHAAEHLATGGMIILDNSEWFPEASAHLRAAELIEVTFSGFAPIGDATQTTTFFFDRGFNFPLEDRPPGSIGSVPKPKFDRVR